MCKDSVGGTFLEALQCLDLQRCEVRVRRRTEARRVLFTSRRLIVPTLFVHLLTTDFDKYYAAAIAICARTSTRAKLERPRPVAPVS